MAQGDRSKRLNKQREAEAQAAAAQENLDNGETTTTETSSADTSGATNASATPEQIEAFVQGIQAEIKAGNHERPAAILSAMLGLDGNAGIKAEDLSSLITGATFGPIALGKINSGLREKNPNHVDFKAADLTNIANISDLKTDEFLETLGKFVPAEGMAVFNQFATQDAQNPQQQVQRLAAAEQTIEENKKRGEEPFDLMRFLNDDTYQKEQGRKFSGAFQTIEKMAVRLSSFNHPLAQGFGQILLNIVGFVKPMLENFLPSEDPDAGPSAEVDDPDLQAGIDAARASKAGREEFETASAEPAGEAIVTQRPVHAGGKPATITSGQ